MHVPRPGQQVLDPRMPAIPFGQNLSHKFFNPRNPQPSALRVEFRQDMVAHGSTW